MTMNATDRPALQRWRSGSLGPWRAPAAAPATIGSLPLLLVLFGGMGPRLEGLVLLGWLAFGAVLHSRVGERVAVRVGCGFHRQPPRKQPSCPRPGRRHCGAASSSFMTFSYTCGAPPRPTRMPPAHAASRSPPGSSPNFKHNGWPGTTWRPCSPTGTGKSSDIAPAGHPVRARHGLARRTVADRDPTDDQHRPKRSGPPAPSAAGSSRRRRRDRGHRAGRAAAELDDSSYPRRGRVRGGPLSTRRRRDQSARRACR